MERIVSMSDEKTRVSIAEAFARAKAERRVALIPYVLAGYPDLATCEALALRLDEAGADIVELGVPFSDPLADGATIQAASQRALEQGVTLQDTLALAGHLSERMRAPLVLMTYYNPIYSFGVAHFCEAASAAGVAGVIVPDLPPEEAEYLQDTAIPYGVEAQLRRGWCVFATPIVSPIESSATPSASSFSATAATASGATAPSYGQPNAVEM